MRIHRLYIDEKFDKKYHNVFKCFSKNSIKLNIVYFWIN